MSSDTIAITKPTDETFETGPVLTIVGGHFIHDIYTSFLSPLLPLLIEKLSLSLTLAGSLSALTSLSGLLNPFIGYLADKVSLRYFVIFAPGVTATLISSMGFAPSYFILATILFVTGISVAAFHAPAPAMIGEVSGKKVGLGMSLFMAGGELGRSIGPLLAVWAVSTWTLDGYYRIMALGWVATVVLYFRLHNIQARPVKNGSLQAIRPLLKRLFLPLVLITIFRNLIISGISVYLPTFMNSEGASLMIAGSALSIYEFAGVGGALTSGTLSDRFGRKFILVASAILSTVFLLLFLNVQGWMQAVVLLLFGFVNLSSMPVMLAIVQEQVPNNRAVGNGLFMAINFLALLLTTLVVGAIGDAFGLRVAFYIIALAALLSIPAIFLLPTEKRS